MTKELEEALDALRSELFQAETEATPSEVVNFARIIIRMLRSQKAYWARQLAKSGRSR